MIRLLTVLFATGIVLAGCAPVLVGGTAASIGVAHDRRTAGTVVEDQSIELKAASALGRDALIGDDNHVNVTSYNNVVLLSGEVRTAETSRRVESMVRQIDKVRQVFNELAVAPPSSMASRASDTWITTKVKTSLLQVDGLRDFDPTRVKVVTERGVVYLFGLLRPEEAESVTRAVRRVGGVQKVVRLFESV